MGETAQIIAGRDFQWPLEAARYLAAYEAVFVGMAVRP
jgi:hypothetical protein